MLKNVEMKLSLKEKINCAEENQRLIFKSHYR